MDNEQKGLVLDIQRMSTEDGPGIRTTLFFKGCPLNCLWCHNPESISREREVHWLEPRCIDCNICIDACLQKAIDKGDEGIAINRDLCKACGTCVDECPSTALELLGTVWSVDDLLHEILKDRVYFQKSGGGITISGGEPTLQTPFIYSLLLKLKEEAIHTALDTSGLCNTESLDNLLPYIDLVMIDIKEMDPAKHKKFTGVSNEIILKNVIYINSFIKDHIYPKSLWIRTPIIPDMTDTEKNIAVIGQFINKNNLKEVERWELCSFNNLCKDKYARLDKEWVLGETPLIERERMEYFYNIACQSGVNPSIIQWSGSTRLEESVKSTTNEADKKFLKKNTC